MTRTTHPGVFVLGSGITAFGERWDQSLRDLMREAIATAIADSHVEPTQIQAIFVANMAAGMFENQVHLGPLASSMVAELAATAGNSHKTSHFPPAMRIEGACASGSLALVAAQQALQAKVYDTVLVVGVEKMTDVAGELATAYLSAAADRQLELGSTFPGLYAMLAQQHMAQYGTTREQLSSVSVKNHNHALDNPHAQFHKKFTLEQVSSSALVADPLRLLDCSPISDGAAAVVFSTRSTDTAKLKILGYGVGCDTLDLAGRASLTSLGATQRARVQAEQHAGRSINQAQWVEVHDCFTIAELMALEDLGLCAPGDAGQATLEGKTSDGAAVVVNRSGGLKASGHPVGATGVKQVAFLAQRFTQPGALAVTHNVGGSGATAVVHLLEGIVSAPSSKKQPQQASKERS